MNNYNPWMLHLSYELDSSNGCFGAVSNSHFLLLIKHLIYYVKLASFQGLFGNEGAEERLLKKKGVKGVEGVRTTSNRRIKETQIAR
jgi:hypothetical protein